MKVFSCHETMNHFIQEISTNNHKDKMVKKYIIFALAYLKMYQIFGIKNNYTGTQNSLFDF